MAENREDDSVIEQASLALEFLQHLATLELGYDESAGRELTTFEGEVKESALACLLEYFVSDLSKRMDTKPKGPKEQLEQKRKEPTEAN